jgi:hypothetical protein
MGTDKMSVATMLFILPSRRTFHQQSIANINLRRALDNQVKPGD